MREDGRKSGKEKRTKATGTTKGNQRVDVRGNGEPQRRCRRDMRIVTKSDAVSVDRHSFELYMSRRNKRMSMNKRRSFKKAKKFNTEKSTCT